MEDQQRKRLIVLGVAGAIFVGGMGYWMWSKSAKEAADEQVMVHMPTTQRPAVATTVPLTGASTSITNIRPAAGLPVGTTLPNASIPGNPPVGGTPTIKPAVAVTPVVPGATPVTALQPAASITAAVKPVVPAIVATTKTPSELDSFNAAKINAASKTLVAAKPVQPVVPAAVPVVTPAVAKAPAAVAAKAPVKAVAKAPSLPNGAALPNLLSKIIPGAAGNAPAVATAPAKDGIVAAPGLKTIRDGIPATPVFEAATAARKEIGRVDPMQPLMTFLPFPRNGRSAPAATNPSGSEDLVPPPPPGEDAAETKKTVGVGVTQTARKNIQKAGADNLVPPPPPSAEPLSGSGGSIAGMPIDQLPVPPSKPTIGDKMKVLAVMDDKAIICFPKAMAIRNKWPRTLTLATGQEFESVKIIGVSKDGVTIEEDNERTLKPISTVK